MERATPGMFDRGIAINPLLDPAEFLRRREPYPAVMALWRRGLGLPSGTGLSEMIEAMQPASLLTRAHELKSPVLLIGGSHDGLVPAHLQSRFANALKGHGIDVRAKVYPGEGHTIARQQNVIDMHQEIIGFLADWMGPSGNVGAQIDSDCLPRPGRGNASLFLDRRAPDEAAQERTHH